MTKNLIRVGLGLAFISGTYVFAQQQNNALPEPFPQPINATADEIGRAHV